MSDTAEYTSELAQSYKKLSNQYIEQAKAYDELSRLHIAELKRADAAEDESREQARLLGMSAEREGALRSKLKAAEARIRAVADALLEDVTSQQGGAK